ncbi:interferon-induced transmembrane protein 3-like [Silurus meridionalis]|uniref:interferon-induced transmembrane protein 3-like n=1 Tax=Silurus meridionalis TaxID=175797 RepID=UPI001EEABC94|nr:interferon-induced transmembrane protein 3-like [Silurus meridionalis]
MQSTMVPLNSLSGDGRGTGTVIVGIPEPPSDYVVWSIASVVYGNPCCLGLIAYYFSMKARDQKLLGDIAGAQTYASKALRFNRIALALIIILTALFMLIVVICVKLKFGSVFKLVLGILD